MASQYKNDIKATNQPKTVKSILTKAGFKKNNQGFYALKGKVVKFSIEDPIVVLGLLRGHPAHVIGTEVRRHRRHG